MAKKIIITGASGFIGKALVIKLRNQNNYVYEFNGKNFYEINNLEEKVDIIIHLAVFTKAGDYSRIHSGEQFLINSEINNEILKYWKNYQPQAHFITFGSSCGYDKDVLKTPNNYLLGQPEPGYEVYGNIKRHLLIGLQALAKEYGMKYTYFIPSTVYGPGYKLDDKHFIYDLIRKIYNGKYGDEVVLWGDGLQMRELIYIDDVVNIVSNFETYNQHCGVLNLSNGNSLFLNTYAQFISRYFNYDYNKIIWDKTAFVGSYSKTLISSFSNFNFTKLEEGLKETMNYYIYGRIS